MRGRSIARGLTPAAFVVLVLGLAPPAAVAAFPGENGMIAFVRSPSTGDEEIATIDPGNQAVTPLTDDAGFDDDPAYSPDGERIVFTRAAGPETEIAIMDFDGQNPVPLIRGSSVTEPSFSPDGRKIVFRSYDGADGEIVVMDADGQNPVQLTNNSVDDGQPVFSPDGSRIAFTHFDGADYEIFSMGPDGQNQVPLTDAAQTDNDPDFSPDGQRMVFTRTFGFNGAEVFAMDAGGGNEVRLTTNAVNDFDPAYSPDGRRLVFVRTSPADFYELFTMDPDGQNPVGLTSALGDYDDSPDWQPLTAPTLDLSGAAKQKSARVVTVTVAAGPEDVVVTLEGTVSAKKVPKGASGARKTKTFALAGQTIELAPGQAATVQMEIPEPARKLLKRGFVAGKKGTAAVTATAVDDLGASAQDTQQAKLKKKKK